MNDGQFSEKRGLYPVCQSSSREIPGPFKPLLVVLARGTLEIANLSHHHQSYQNTDSLTEHSLCIGGSRRLYWRGPVVASTRSAEQLGKLGEEGPQGKLFIYLIQNAVI